MPPEILEIANLNVSGPVQLPSSKSISNRALIIQALSEGRVKISNLSDAEDTKVLVKALSTADTTIDVGAAGTAMRFLAAYFSFKQGQKVLTGSERMQQRPIKPLTDALSGLGAGIEWVGKEGYPPIKITGGKLKGGSISINPEISSQFISALMMIGPLLQQGLLISLKGNVVSAPYIEMTAQLMRHCGAEVEIGEKQIQIFPGVYKPSEIQVEADWSAASYFYEYAALSAKELILVELKQGSLQGDSVIAEIFKNFGISTRYTEEGCILTPNGQRVEFFDYNFINCPDLAQAVAVTMAGLGIKGRLSGLGSLRIKETDRIKAMVAELLKFGMKAEAGADYIIIPGGGLANASAIIETYEDHRMAMAFAPLAAIFPGIKIASPQVVAKSFPDFWKQLGAYINQPKRNGFFVD
jgi:3-phosphoshikimate 1-carboxyvinyltransferase